MDCNLQLKHTALDQFKSQNKLSRQIFVSDSMQDSSVENI